MTKKIIIGSFSVVFLIIILALLLASPKPKIKPSAQILPLVPRQQIDQLTAKKLVTVKADQAKIGTPLQTLYFAPILTFHYISTTSETSSVAIGLHIGPKEFDKILQGLRKNGYQTVFASDIAAYLARGERPPKNWVALTFDDGYRDFYTNAMPLLQKYQAKATLFIITAATGPAYLTPDQIKDISQSGLVEIGSHTVNHPMLSKLSAADQSRELVESKSYLEKLLHEDISLICYPYGDFDARVEKLAQQAGYSFGLTYNHHPLEDSPDMFAIDRVSVWPGMDVIGYLRNLAERNDKLRLAASTINNPNK